MKRYLVPENYRWILIEAHTHHGTTMVLMSRWAMNGMLVTLSVVTLLRHTCSWYMEDSTCHSTRLIMLVSLHRYFLVQ